MFRPYLGLWRGFLTSYKRIATFRSLFLGLAVGVCAGLAASLFFLGVEGVKFLLLHKTAGLALPAPKGEEIFFGEHGPLRPWLVPIFLTAVGLATGWLTAKFIPEAIDSGTDGTDAMIKSFHRQDGIIRLRNWLIRGTAAALTIGAGGSAGREGPISQIGAGIGSWLSRRFGLSARERRIMLLAGAAGGLGAIFRAPLGGALTAIEVIYREDFEAEAILPSVLSSVVAYSLFTFFYGTEPIFGIPEFAFENAAELPFYALLAVFCSVTGWLFVKSFYALKYDVFARLRQRVGVTWTMAAGGLVMGLAGWTLATSAVIGSGMSGGMFAPALFVGGMSGGIVGQLAHQFYPEIVTRPGGYVLVGMAAFFAGVANAPIGPLIMVCELTQGYGLLAPLMLASALCLVLNRNVSLYENQVDNKFESPAHAEDATINILEQLHVAEFFHPGTVTTLEEGTTLKAFTDIMAGTNELNFPVKNDEGEITGIVGVRDVRKILFESCLFDLVVVKEVARPPVTLTPRDDLYSALLKFVDSDLSQIPVVSVEDRHEIIGLIDREDVFKAYSDTIKEVKNGGPGPRFRTKTFG
jgi:CIC family chloride channel protein